MPLQTELVEKSHCLTTVIASKDQTVNEDVRVAEFGDSGTSLQLKVDLLFMENILLGACPTSGRPLTSHFEHKQYLIRARG